jgi:hypothetical protein
VKKKRRRSRRSPRRKRDGADGVGLIICLGRELAGFPEVAEHLAAQHFNFFAVIERCVLFEGLIEALDGATPGTWQGRRRGGSFFKFVSHARNLTRAWVFS